MVFFNYARHLQIPVFFLCFSVTLFAAGYPGIARQKAAPQQGLIPVQLSCEYRTGPLGIDCLQPRLGWILKAAGAERDQRQTAFRIQVATSREALLSGKPDLWDSGKTDTAQSNNIRYTGKLLQSDMRCYWRVMTWDKYHRPGPWSDLAYWTLGLLHPSDWQGRWITDSKQYPSADSLQHGDLPAPVFRREFPVTKKITRAVLYVSGLGYYEAYLNGRRIGNQLLDPGWTDYAKRVFYSTYDVTPLLQSGANCLGIMLGNGWYNPLPLHMWGRFNLRETLPVGRPAFILQLHIRYADGTSGTVVSDQSWQAADGAVIRNNIYLGEKYDARREILGWNRPGLKAGIWRPVNVSGNVPAGHLQSQFQPPVIARDTLYPQHITRAANGKYIVDFGRNFAGIIRLKAAGKAGMVIKARYGELLYPDGTLNVMTSVAGQVKRKGMGGPGAPDTAYACDIFILNGKGKELFQPHFTFHGFRYAEISGYPGTLRPGDIQGLVLHADVPDAGNFTCSDTLINRTQQACRNTFLSNLFSVQSDCPHRERFGYGGDILATCEAFMNNFDMSTFYAKTVQDYADAAQPDGGLTETAPFVGIADEGLGGQSGPIEWGSALPVLLYHLYQYYGDLDLISRHYITAKNWLDFISRHADNYIIDKTIGDHESIDPKPIAVSGTACYYYNAKLLAYFAGLLHRQEDAAEYAALAEKIKAAFIKKFWDPASGNVDIHTEAAQAYALYFGLIPPSSEQAALQVLQDDISIVHKDHVSTGMFGTKFMFEVLSRYGMGTLACKMVDQRTFPGWGYMLNNGATTIWEHWAFSNNTYSHNHPMFGSVSEWFYRHLAGIQPDTDAVAYNRIVIRPDIIRGLDRAAATYHSVNGLIESRWKKDAGQFRLDVIIPVNTTARIYVPATNIDAVTEGRKNIRNMEGLTFTGMEKGYAVLHAGSGNYHFVSSSFGE